MNPIEWLKAIYQSFGTPYDRPDTFQQFAHASCDGSPCLPQANFAIMAEAVTLAKRERVRR